MEKKKQKQKQKQKKKKQKNPNKCRLEIDVNLWVHNAFRKWFIVEFLENLYISNYEQFYRDNTEKKKLYLE